ncbi:MAG: MBL fold metallo-hydrolase [Candidatus Eisenbacteria bacterium]|nr:MBL fold metallo-hydrolase [Candidatus Eisenbacteria bacterium]
MILTVHGAARNVTGSKHVLQAGGRRVLLDCGLFQGRRAESERRNRNLPFDPRSIDAVLLSHAHVDHCGSLPTLVKNGFRGRIFCTGATADLADILLRDSAYVQRQDLEYLNRRRRKRGDLPLEPVYTEDDVDSTVGLLTPVAYGERVDVLPGVEAVFRDAGHILGSATIQIDAREGSTSRTIVFTGDLGRSDMPILRDPTPVHSADVLVTESTYGARTHGPIDEIRDELSGFLRRTIRRRGKVIIPSFAVGRTQRIVYELHVLMSEGRVPEVPIFVDSPLAVRATEVFRKHAECYDEDMRSFVAEGNDPLGFSRATYIEDVRESKKLNDMPGPAVIISASGMCEAGRVLHHLKNHIGKRRNAVLIVGYQAEHTLGRRIAAGEKRIKIFGKVHSMRARVAVFGEFSAHADRDELLAFALGIKRQPRRTVVVHGSEEQALSLANLLTERGLPGVVVPLDGESIPID